MSYLRSASEIVVLLLIILYMGEKQAQRGSETPKATQEWGSQELKPENSDFRVFSTVSLVIDTI